MSNDVQAAVYDLGRAFESFKDANDQRLREIERRGHADPLDATHRLDVKIEHAEDDGTGAPAAYVPCSAADLGGAEANGGVFLSVNAAAREKTRHLVSYQGGKRFVRLSVTPVGLTAGGPVAIVAIKGNLAQKPQA